MTNFLAIFGAVTIIVVVTMVLWLLLGVRTPTVTAEDVRRRKEAEAKWPPLPPGSRDGHLSDI